MPLANNLSDPIEKALSNSDFLIVICTPRLAASRWCEKEIETFIKMHGREHVLLVLAEGEPAESFPELMTYQEVEVTDADGNTVIERKPLKPLAADVRGMNNKQRLNAMDIAVIKLAAAMFGLNFDDVRQRHREQKLKKRIRISGAITSVVAIFALVCLVLLARIKTQNEVLQEKYANSQASAAEELLECGKRNDALYATLSVLPKSGDYNSEAFQMLSKAVSPYSTGISIIPTKNYKVNSTVDDYCISKNGEYLAVLAGEELSIFDVATEKVIFEGSSYYENNGLQGMAFDGNKGLIYCGTDDIRYYDILKNEDRQICDTEGGIMSNPTTDVISVIADGKLYSFSDSQLLYTVNLEDMGIEYWRYMFYDFGYSEDGHTLTIVANNSYGESLVTALEVKDGAIDTAFYYKMEGKAYVTSNEYFIFLVDNYSGGTMTKLYLINLHSAESYGTVNLPVNFVTDIFMVDGKMCVSALNTAMLFDQDTFDQIGSIEGCGNIVDTFVNDEKLYAVDHKGIIYEFGEEFPFGQPCTISWFESLPATGVVGVKNVGDEYYFLYDDANYIALYEENPDSRDEEIEERDIPYDERFQEGDDAFSELKDIKDVQPQYVFNAVYSYDKSYIALKMTDGSTRIYDKKHKLVKVLYELGELKISSFAEINHGKEYILTIGSRSYLLNERFECVDRMHSVVAFEKDTFYIYDDKKYYKVPYASYSEILRKGYEYLGDYKPDDGTLEKYNMMKY